MPGDDCFTALDSAVFGLPPDDLCQGFNARTYTYRSLSITIYGYDPGHFMVSGGEKNDAVYMLYREAQEVDAYCIILGNFTKSWAVHPIDKPFKCTLQSMSTPMSCSGWLNSTTMDFPRITDALGPAAPTVDQLERIAQVLGVRASDILPF